MSIILFLGREMKTVTGEQAPASISPMNADGRTMKDVTGETAPMSTAGGLGAQGRVIPVVEGGQVPMNQPMNQQARPMLITHPEGKREVPGGRSQAGLERTSNAL